MAPSPTALAEASRAAAQLTQSDDAPILKALTKAIGDSPYSAIVQHTRVEVQRDGSDAEKHIRHDRVLETLRGPSTTTGKMDDPLYFLDDERYVPLDVSLDGKLMCGEVTPHRPRAEVRRALARDPGYA